MIQLSDRAEGWLFVDGAHLTADHLTTKAGLTYAAGEVGLSLVYELRMRAHARRVRRCDSASNSRDSAVHGGTRRPAQP